jgi:hypothetical protein
MNKFKTITIASALVAGTAFASQASALTIDFTDAALWGNPGGSTASYTAASADVTYPGPFEVTVSSRPTASTQISWESQDGFGVSGAGDDANWDDDIENFNGDTSFTERLRIDFSANALVQSIRISDFFGTGEYNTGSGWMTFGPGAGTNGPGDTFAITTTASSNIRFRAVGNASSFQVSGLEVAVGDVAPVPLPPAVWLLGSAMVFLMRKRQVS